jgi:N-carbamoylputrescine amidase
MRIALLHLEPKTGDLSHNAGLIETAARTAASMGAEWIVTPELCVSGYMFGKKMGTEWIDPYPDAWTIRFCELAAELRVTLFLSHQERDGARGKLYNATFVIAAAGSIVGRHRKVNVVTGCEGWASRGEDPAPIAVGSVSAGVLICADSWTPDAAKRLRERGAQILVSPASWPPRPHGPDGCWQARTRETGLPMFVCNRTGIDETLDCREAQSVVVDGGEILMAFQSEQSSVVLVDWDVVRRELIGFRSCPVQRL